MFSSLTFPPLIIWHATCLFGNYSSTLNSFTKRVTATCVEVPFEIWIVQCIGAKILHVRHKYALIDVYGRMCRSLKRFKRPPFCSPLLSHLAICRHYGPNHSRKRHSIKEIWQQDKQAIVIVCDREAGRLQILVTTGGNVSVACFYHMVSTKGIYL